FHEALVKLHILHGGEGEKVVMIGKLAASEIEVGASALGHDEVARAGAVFVMKARMPRRRVSAQCTVLQAQSASRTDPHPHVSGIESHPVEFDILSNLDLQGAEFP